MSRLGSSAAHRLLQALHHAVTLNRSQIQQPVVLNRSPAEHLGRLFDARHCQGYLREALPTSLPNQRLPTFPFNQRLPTLSFHPRLPSSFIPGNQPWSLVSLTKQTCHSLPNRTAWHHPPWHLKSLPSSQKHFGTRSSESIPQLASRLTSRLEHLPNRRLGESLPGLHCLPKRSLGNPSPGLEHPKTGILGKYLVGLERSIKRSLEGLGQVKHGLPRRSVQRRGPPVIAPTVLSAVLLLKSTTALALGPSKYTPQATGFLVLPQSHLEGAAPWSEQDPNSLGIRTDPRVEMVVHADRVRQWWVRRLLLPALALALVCLAWTHRGPMQGLSVLVSILLLTRPSLQSLEMHLEEQRMLLELEDGGIIDRVQRHLLRLAQVEFHDCHLFAFARLHSISQTKTMVGILGQWWELQTVSWSFFTGWARRDP